jgi:hypothetical protein
MTTSSSPAANNELEVIEQLQEIAEDKCLCVSHEPEENAQEFAHRILNELADAMTDFAETQRNVLALIT